MEKISLYTIYLVLVTNNPHDIHSTHISTPLSQEKIFSRFISFFLPKLAFNGYCHCLMIHPTGEVYVGKPTQTSIQQ